MPAQEVVQCRMPAVHGHSSVAQLSNNPLILTILSTKRN